MIRSTRRHACRSLVDRTAPPSACQQVLSRPHCLLDRTPRHLTAEELEALRLQSNQGYSHRIAAQRSHISHKQAASRHISHAELCKSCNPAATYDHQVFHSFYELRGFWQTQLHAMRHLGSCCCVASIEQNTILIGRVREVASIGNQ